MCKRHLALVIARSAVGVANGQEPAKIDFIRDVRPLFKVHCIGCHAPKQQKNAFRLDRRRVPCPPRLGGHGGKLVA